MCLFEAHLNLPSGPGQPVHQGGPGAGLPDGLLSVKPPPVQPDRAKKAAKILRDFTEISNRTGLTDRLIPPHVIAKAEGLAIISVIKAGFMITARGGSGIVIARLGDRLFQHLISEPWIPDYTPVSTGTCLSLLDLSVSTGTCLSLLDLSVSTGQSVSTGTCLSLMDQSVSTGPVVSIGPVCLYYWDPSVSTGPVCLYWACLSLLGPVCLYWDPSVSTGTRLSLLGPVCLYWTCLSLLDQSVSTGPVCLYWTSLSLLDQWSAPSAIGIAGLGGGFEIGVERRAVDAFTKGGNLTLGGNCTVAVGPIGRNVEADVSIRSPAAVFTYCRSRGLFAGISLEGSGLIERKDTNRKFYGREIRASAILNGDVEPPPECYDLYHILDEYTDAYTADWTSKNMRPKSSGPPSRPSVPPQQKPSSGYQQPATTDKDALYPSISETSAGGGASGELVVKATHPFTGQQPGDLSFVPGDSITVVTKTRVAVRLVGGSS
ncbi:hypothetical protein KUCAC02_033664 [Chaenocephalus aceratus]|nr:hypothetical protein KUCAC02_033664 [Chaenocephalus aceratus]